MDKRKLQKLIREKKVRVVNELNRKVIDKLKGKKVMLFLDEKISSYKDLHEFQKRLNVTIAFSRHLGIKVCGAMIVEKEQILKPKKRGKK